MIFSSRKGRQGRKGLSCLGDGCDLCVRLLRPILSQSMQSRSEGFAGKI